MIWRIITGEYPPQKGGVSDHTQVIALALAAAGDEVDVWAPATSVPDRPEPGITVHRLPGCFGAAALRRLDHDLRDVRAGRVLIEYVPQAFGWNGMNLPFCIWLYARRRWAPSVMFHEVMFPLERGRPLRHKLIAVTNWMMAALAARAASRIFVATPIWSEVLHTRARIQREITWLPLPTNLPVAAENGDELAVRKRYASTAAVMVGCFGAFPPSIRADLSRLIPNLLRGHPRLAMLLLGTNSTGFRAELVAQNPELAARIQATGELPADQLSRHLKACDLILQLYPDGACTRRTTLIAALAHGCAIVTTRGPATELLWERSGAVALVVNDDAAITRRVLELAACPARRAHYGEAAAALYARQFDVLHAISLLRAVGCESR